MEPIAKNTQAGIAAALGIDPSLVSRYRKRGMPVHSVSAAVAWRDENVRVRVSVDSPVDRVSEALRGEEAASHAANLLLAAGELMEAGGSIAPMVPSLRQAMARVPPGRQRERVLAPFRVLDVLTDDVARVMEQGDPSGQLVGALYGVDPMRPIDMGAFWYAVAAGEIRLRRTTG